MSSRFLGKRLILDRGKLVIFSQCELVTDNLYYINMLNLNMSVAMITICQILFRTHEFM